MHYRIVYREVSEGGGRPREIIVEAADEGAAYDQAMGQMLEDEALIEVAPVER